MIYIDAEKVYDATDQGLTIFQYYFPREDLHDQKHFVKCRKDEKTASAKVSLYKGKWRITDFGNQSEVKSMNGVAYVMWAENLIYIDALRFIQEVIIRREVGGKEFRRPSYKPDYSWRDVEANDKKGEYRFTYKDKPSQADLRSIGRYVSAELLDKFNMKALEKYEMVSYSDKYKKDIVNVFASTEDFPMFVLDEGSFKKIYKPHELEKRYRFHYVGAENKPANYIFGLKQLQEATNEFINPENNEYEYTGPDWKKPKVKDLVRCSGESDALNVASLGFHVYWLNSESAEIDRGSWEAVDGLCDNHYQLMDLDATGKEMAMKFAHKHIDLITIQLPEWLLQKKDWRGNPCKDIKDFTNISGSDQDETADHFLVLKRKAFPMRFWTKNIDKSNGKTVVNYNINLENYYYFLQSHGFYVMDSAYHRKSDYCYAHLNGKIVDLIDPGKIKRTIKSFTKEWIRGKNLLDEVAILNKINSSNQISENNLQDIKRIDPDFNNHDKTTEHIHFKNGSIRIRRDSIEKIKHQELPNYILGRLKMGKQEETVISHLIGRSISIAQPPIEVSSTEAYSAILDRFKNAKTSEERENVNVELANYPDLDKYTIKINDDSFIFTRFLRDLAHIHWRKELEQKIELSDDEKKEQDLLLANLMFILGYMCSQYKNPAKPWLVFLQDIRISDIGKSTGRSGKSLLSKAISYVRPSFYIGGRKNDITKNTDFIYDGFTRFHNSIEVDDFNEFGGFNFFYTQITGNREVNSKNISKQILPYDCSGKMIISSNFELPDTDSSTLARLLNCAVSDYYHERTKSNGYKESRDPALKFGKQLYDEFTEEEWVKFYNFIAYCIQLQMRFHKIQPPMDNLEKRQLRRQMTKGVSRDEEFFTWANHYFTVAPDQRPAIAPDGGMAYYNVLFKREEAFENFKATLSPSQSGKYKSNQFKSSLSAWCEYYGYTLNPLHLCSGINPEDDRRILKKIEGKTTECFYICTDPQAHIQDEGEHTLTEEEQKDLPF